MAAKPSWRIVRLRQEAPVKRVGQSLVALIAVVAQGRNCSARCRSPN
jgi:hypothetical protein